MGQAALAESSLTQESLFEVTSLEYVDGRQIYSRVRLGGPCRGPAAVRIQSLVLSCISARSLYWSAMPASGFIVDVVTRQHIGVRGI